MVNEVITDQIELGIFFISISMSLSFFGSLDCRTFRFGSLDSQSKLPSFLGSVAAANLKSRQTSGMIHLIVPVVTAAN